MPITQAKIHQELAKLLPLGYTVTGEHDAYLAITSPRAVVIAQVQLSSWALESENNLRAYFSNLQPTLNRYIV